MNKYWYNYGNIFKVKFRNHRCYKCDSNLSIMKHRKVVNQKSEEAKYYDFDAGLDGGVMVGPCEFIHKVFYCSNCAASIEFITQLSFEDVDIFIKKLKHKFFKKGFNIDIKKTYETKENKYIDRVNSLEDIQNLCLTICENDKEVFVCKFPLMRKNNWERPYYFEVNKKQVAKSIEQKMMQ